PFALASGVAAPVAAFLATMAGLGTRVGLWHYTTGFLVLRWALYGAAAVLLLSVFAMYRTRPGTARRGFIVALGAFGPGVITLAIPWRASRAGADAPPIHDITTDTDNPPSFIAIAPLRADAPNPIAYEGEDVARLQRAAYPDIRPAILDMSRDLAYQHALETAERMGWSIVAADPVAGQIEATDRTFWFGFREDVVIRLTPVNNRTVVYVRSKYRDRSSDMGSNARRVREYLAA